MPTIQRIHNANDIIIFNLIKKEIGSALFNLRNWNINLEKYNEIALKLHWLSLNLQQDSKKKNIFIKKENIEKQIMDFKKAILKI
jgi:hypothetical protein